MVFKIKIKIEKMYFLYLIQFFLEMLKDVLIIDLKYVITYSDRKIY